MDVDGVLTDGAIVLVPLAGGEVGEAKFFHALDGAGLILAHEAGIKTGVITKRKSEAVAQRAREVALDFVAVGAEEKLQAYREILSAAGCREDEVCFIGDDLPDLPVMLRVGFAVAVANAHEEVRKRAHYVTRARGGQGAVREVTDLLLKARGKWKSALDRFTR